MPKLNLHVSEALFLCCYLAWFYATVIGGYRKLKEDGHRFGTHLEVFIFSWIGVILGNLILTRVLAWRSWKKKAPKMDQMRTLLLFGYGQGFILAFSARVMVVFADGWTLDYYAYFALTAIIICARVFDFVDKKDFGLIRHRNDPLSHIIATFQVSMMLVFLMLHDKTKPQEMYYMLGLEVFFMVLNFYFNIEFCYVWRGSFELFEELDLPVVAPLAEMSPESVPDLMEVSDIEYTRLSASSVTLQVEEEEQENNQLEGAV